MKKYLISRLLFSIFISAAFAVTANAASVTLPAATSFPNQTTGDPCSTVVNFYGFALFISGILAFGAIVYGGIKYAVSAGNPSGQSDGIEWIKGALLGILLLAGAVVLLNIINPSLTKCSLPKISELPAQTANMATAYAPTRDSAQSRG